MTEKQPEGLVDRRNLILQVATNFAGLVHLVEEEGRDRAELVDHVLAALATEIAHLGMAQGEIGDRLGIIEGLSGSFIGGALFGDTSTAEEEEDDPIEGAFKWMARRQGAAILAASGVSPVTGRAAS
jgi:hypothetical protein